MKFWNVDNKSSVVPYALTCTALRATHKILVQNNTSPVTRNCTQNPQLGPFSSENSLKPRGSSARIITKRVITAEVLVEMDLQCGGPWQDSEDWTGTSNLKILLDHPQGVFYPGSQVGGKISFELDEPKPFLGLRLKCEGEGLVYFTDRSAGFRRKFSNDQSYMCEEIFLFSDGESEVTIPGGESVFRFSVSLPENIPCSFEGRYGRVRYSISASLERTKLVRMTETVPFTVAPVLDLNQDPLAPLPISEDNSKAIVGQSEPLEMSVTIPVRGFVPGQTIPVKIVLKNPCNVDIRKLRVVLKKRLNVRILRMRPNDRKEKCL